MLTHSSIHSYSYILPSPLITTAFTEVTAPSFTLHPSIKFFLSFETPGGHGALAIQLDAKVSEYLDFVMTLIFAFGLCFQLPVLLALLGRVGIISSAQLRSVRRYAILGIVVLAAIITPPDPFSMMSLALPLVLLYEISIWCVRLIERDRAQKDAAAASKGSGT